MNYELAAQIILIFSLLGIGEILFRKIPVLAELPEITPREEERLFEKAKKKIKDFNPFKSLSSEIFLQKLLSRIRILTLKTDSKTSSWLQRLREKSQRKKNFENDHYWEEIRTSLPDKENLDSSQHSEFKKSTKDR